MALRLKPKQAERITPPIAPMIDMVFLLLVYFMVSATLERQEADLSFELPGTVEQTEPVELPDEQIIEIREGGQVIVNEYPYDTPGANRLKELEAMLSRFRQAADANRTTAQVTIAPADGATHAAIVKVMDAVSAAGIEAVHFASAQGNHSEQP